MRTITALFDTYEHAASAVRAVRDAGIDSADISLVANNVAGDIDADVDAEEGAAAGAGVGAVAGGGAGLLAGLGALAVPGIGPVIAGGWLLATTVGALAGAAVGGAAGGLLGALANAGVPEEEAHVYAEGVRRGGTLVSVRAADDRADSIAAILRHADGVDIDARKANYIAEGWRGFDEDAPAYSEEQIRDYRSVYGSVPPIV
ncbi:MAG: hypothetical protein ACTHKD_08730 [Devosia sp.]|jgi:hypothetical protein|nr:hypothetical protein [Devosia sp.]